MIILQLKGKKTPKQKKEIYMVCSIKAAELILTSSLWYQAKMLTHPGGVKEL